MFGLTPTDIIILILIALYVLTNIQDGVFELFKKLISFIGSAILAFLSYGYVSNFITSKIAAPPGLVDVISFIFVFWILQAIIKYIFGKLFNLIPSEIHFSKASQILAVLPALVDAIILSSLILLLLVVSPILPKVKTPIENSKVGSVLVNKASLIEPYLYKVFGRATQDSLGFLTVKPDVGETIALNFKATKLSTDSNSEKEMIELLNAERVKLGIEPLVYDEDLTDIARLHSEDMFKRSYFSHIDPDGNDPFARMRRFGAKFKTAGENLALARSAGRAHQGLMNSPGHKRNILDPSFKKIGIGVIDGGIYGKMFTQTFSD